MSEDWLYLVHPKTGVRCAVLSENYADKHAEGYRLDPEVGEQEAPKVKASESDSKAAHATKPSE